MAGRLATRSLHHLPPLSWLCVVGREGAPLSLFHGRHVIVLGNAFFEGAWSGSLSDLDFEKSSNVFGSGGKRLPHATLFVPPSHTLEPLYVFRSSDVTAVSNSLAFLLSYCDADLYPNNWRYGALFCSIVSGLGKNPLTIPCRGGELSVVYHRNFAINDGKQLQIIPKPLPPSFGSYADYQEYLRRVLERVCENAWSMRSRQYRPLCLLSSGYDSSACAALARTIGCSEALSLTRAGAGDPDSGAELASALGLSLKEFERIDRAAGSGFSEAEFLAGGMQAEDFVYRVFEKELNGRLVLTGFHGDKVWEKGVAPTPYIKRGDVSGCSLGEFRLVSDFLHVPVPFIGCQRHSDIWKISNSAEMRCYSTGGSYDRPIPRRIAEDAGAPRGSFGQAKKATSIHFFWRPSLMSDRTVAEIKKFSLSEPIPFGDRITYLLLALRWNIGAFLVYLSRRLRFSGKSGKGKDYSRTLRIGNAVFARIFGIDFSVFEHSHPRNTTWLRWALSEMKKRYAAAGTKARPTDDSTTAPDVVTH